MNRAFALLITMLCAAGGPATAQAQDTFAVVTQVQGSAFLSQPGGATTPLHGPGAGFLRGQELLLDGGAVVRLTDRSGHRYLIVGPAHVTATHDALDITRGAVAVTAVKGVAGARLQSAGLAGESSAVAALWVSGARAQWLTVSGTGRTWHPEHPAVTVNVAAGNYTESSVGREYLEPRSPRQPDEELANAFLEVFGESLAKPVVAKAHGHQPVVAHQESAVHGDAPAKAVSARPHREVYAAFEPGTEPGATKQKPAALHYAANAASHDAHRAIASERKPAAPPSPPVSRAELMARLTAHVEGQSFDADAFHNDLSKEAEAAKRKRMAELSKRKALVGKREDSFKHALGEGHGAVAERKPASTPEVKVKAVGDAGYEDEDELVKRTGIINKLIQGKDPGH